MHGRGTPPPSAPLWAGDISTPPSTTAPASPTRSPAPTRKAPPRPPSGSERPAWFAQLGFACERALTDNGACYRSDAFKTALAATATTHKTTRT